MTSIKGKSFEKNVIAVFVKSPPGLDASSTCLLPIRVGLFSHAAATDIFLWFFFVKLNVIIRVGKKME